MEEITYSGLVECICRKIKVDESKVKVKISYFPMVLYSYKPSYIRNDDEIFGYLLQVNHEKCRSVLHVEFINEEVKFSEEDDEIDGYVGLSDREAIEAGDEDGTENDETDAYVGISDRETIEAGDEDGNGGVLTFDEDIEMHDGVNQTRDDGMDLVIGQEFLTKEAAKVLIQTASYQNCFEFDIIKSDTKRFVVKCRGAKDGCKWFVRVAMLENSDIWMVRSYIKQHTCSIVTTRTLRDRRKGTKQIVASVLAQDYPGTFDTPVPKVLIDLVHRKVGVKVSYTAAWRGKREAANEVRGSPEESFTLLHCYMHMLEQTNIATRTLVEVDEHQRFKYLFFALGASVEGFRAMRKVLIVYATHLKNVYGGVLLVATAQDPDHHHYPIAFGVADGENDQSWIWFMEQLKLAITDVPGLVFLSDRNRSLIKAVRLVFPEAEHGYCIWHLSQNVKGHVHNNKDTCAFKFRECAHAYTVAEFQYLYHAFRRKYPSAAAYLDKSVEEKKWARCYFKGDRYNVDTTNSVESFNGVIRGARMYTLLPMFDVIIAKMAEWFNKYRKKAAEVPYNLKLVPIVEEEMSKRCVEGGFLTVKELNSFHLEYSVQGADGKVYTVDMAMYTCSCEQFDKDKYPCVHAVAAATFMTHKAGKELHLSEYCSKYYLVEQWALAYHRTIYHVPHMSDWVIREEVRAKKILPPDFEVKKGKPQQTRFPSVGESRGRGKRGKGSGRGSGRGTGRARGEGLAAYFECGSGSGSGV